MAKIKRGQQQKEEGKTGAVFGFVLVWGRAHRATQTHTHTTQSLKRTGHARSHISNEAEKGCETDVLRCIVIPDRRRLAGRKV